VGSDVISKPLPIKIPQYAYLRDSKQRGILVQAEEAEGKKLFGVRSLDGAEIVTLESDVELLGINKPN